MPKELTNDEIRLILLDDYYNDLYVEDQGKIVGHPRLENISGNLVNANAKYLVEKKLLDGTIEYTGAGPIVFLSSISATGVDIVERILHASIPKLSSTLPKIAETISKIGETAKQFHMLIDLFFSNSEVWQTISDVIRTIFESIV